MNNFQNIYAREKLINAIIFFSEKIDNATLGAMKMLKLLYLFDFEHFRQTGQTSLGLEYEAWEKGPVAKSVYQEFSSPQKDMWTSVKFGPRISELWEGAMGLKFHPLKKFNTKYFSRRELEIMEVVAFLFKELRSEDMSAYTHKRGMPWHTVWNNRKGKGQVISHDLGMNIEPLLNKYESITSERLQEIKENLDAFRSAFPPV